MTQEDKELFNLMEQTVEKLTEIVGVNTKTLKQIQDNFDKLSKEVDSLRAEVVAYKTSFTATNLVN